MEVEVEWGLLLLLPVGILNEEINWKMTLSFL